MLARRNDHQLEITNGTRGRVISIDLERRALTVQPDTGEPTTLDAAYLDAGHLDHAYATTAHALQGASVDHAHVLGTEDLYREWGYTALTRHRHEAHFYLHSHAQTAQPLPGPRARTGPDRRPPARDPRQTTPQEPRDRPRPAALATQARVRSATARNQRERPRRSTPHCPPPRTASDVELAGLLAGLRALSGGRGGPDLAPDR